MLKNEKKMNFFFAHERETRREKETRPKNLHYYLSFALKIRIIHRNTLKYKALDLCIKNSYIIFNYKKKEVNSIAYF
jgi:hypothetical protein